MTATDGFSPGGLGAREFWDVDVRAWYAPWVAAGMQAGLVGRPGRFQAYLGPVFGPEVPATRLEAALMVANLMLAKGQFSHVGP